jgi:hypothetical protein
MSDWSRGSAPSITLRQHCFSVRDADSDRARQSSDGTAESIRSSSAEVHDLRGGYKGAVSDALRYDVAAFITRARDELFRSRFPQARDEGISATQVEPPGAAQSSDYRLQKVPGFGQRIQLVGLPV